MIRLLDTVRSTAANLTGARMRTALTLLSIVVGSLTLTLGLGVGAGLNAYLQQQAGATSATDPLLVSHDGSSGTSVGLLGVEPYDESKSSAGFTALDADDLDAIRGVAGVDRVEPVLSVQVEYVAHGDRKVTGRVAELLPTDEPQLVAGAASPAREPGAAILGHAFVKALGFATPQAAVGKQLDLVVLDQLRKPRNYPVTVAAVSTPSFVGNATISLARQQLEQMHRYQAAGVDDLLSKPALAVAYLQPSASQEAVKAGISALGMTAETTADQAAAAGESLRPLQLAVLGFSLIAILAATFGIVNTLLMSVHERTREIGLLKALGSRNRQIFGQFLTEALLLGLWGAVLGVLFAVVLGRMISGIVAGRAAETFPGLTLFAADVPTVLGAPLLITVVAVLAGVLPARRAMRLDPISALRYE